MEAPLDSLVESPDILRPPRVMRGIVACAKALRSCYDCTPGGAQCVETLREAVQSVQHSLVYTDSPVLSQATHSLACALRCVEHARAVSLDTLAIRATAARVGVATRPGSLVFYASSAASWYGTMLYNAATDLKPVVEYGSRVTGARKEAAPVFDSGVPSYVIVVESHVWAAPLETLEVFLCRMCLMVSDRATYMDARWLDRVVHPLCYGPEAAPWLCLLGHQVFGPHSVTNVSVRTWMIKTQGRLNLVASLGAAEWLPLLDTETDGLVFAFTVGSLGDGCVEAGPGPVAVTKNLVDIHGAAALALELSVGSSRGAPLALQWRDGELYESWASSVYDPRTLSIGFAAFASEMIAESLQSKPVRAALGELRLGRVGRLIETHLVRVIHSLAVRACVAAFASFFVTGDMGDLSRRQVSTLAIRGAVGRVLWTWSPAPLQLAHQAGGLDWLYTVFASAVDNVLANHIVPVCDAIASFQLNGRTLVFEGATVLEETERVFRAKMCEAVRAAGVPGTELAAVDRLVSVVPYTPAVLEPALEAAIDLVRKRTPSASGDIVCVGLPHDVVPRRIGQAVSEACFGLFGPGSFVVVPTSGLSAGHPYAFTLVGPRLALDLYFRYLNPANVLSARLETWPKMQVYTSTGEMPVPVSPAYASAVSRAVQGGLWVAGSRLGIDMASSAILSMTLSVLCHPRRVVPTEPGVSHLVAMVVGVFGLLADVASDDVLGLDLAESNPWAIMVEVMLSLKAETLADGYNTPNKSIRGTHCVAALVAALYSALCSGEEYEPVLVGVQTIVEVMTTVSQRLGSGADAELGLVVRAICEGAHRASEFGEPLQVTLTRAEYESYAPSDTLPLAVSFEDGCVTVTDTVLPLHTRVLWVMGHPAVRPLLGGRDELVSLVFRTACCIRACVPSPGGDVGFGVQSRTYAPYFAFTSYTRRAWADKVFQNTLQDMLRPRSVPMSVPDDDLVGLRQTPARPWPSGPSWGDAGGPIGELTERLAGTDLLPDVPLPEGTALRFGALFFETAEFMMLFAKNSASVAKPRVLKNAAYVHAMRMLCIHGMTFAPLQTSRAFVNRDPKFSRCSGSRSIVEFSGLFADIEPNEGFDSVPRAVQTARGGMSCLAVATTSYPYTRAQCSVQSIVREGVGAAAPDPFGAGGPSRSAVETDYPLLTPYFMVLPTVDAVASFGPVEASGGLWSDRSVVPLGDIRDAWDSPGVRVGNVQAVLPTFTLRRLPVSPLSALGTYAACAVSGTSLTRPRLAFPAQAFAHALHDRTGSPVPIDMDCSGTLVDDARMLTVGPSSTILVPEQAHGLNEAVYPGRLAAYTAAGKLVRHCSVAPHQTAQTSTAALALHRMAEMGASFPKEPPLGMRWRMTLRNWSRHEYDLFGDSYDLDSRFKAVCFSDDETVQKYIDEHRAHSLLVLSSDIRRKQRKRAEAIREAERAKQEAIEAEKKRKKAERDRVPKSALTVRGKLTYDALRTAADLSVFKKRTRKRRRSTQSARRKNQSDESSRGGIAFSNAVLEAGILSTPGIIASMGGMTVDDLLQGVCAEEEEALRPPENTEDPPIYVFDEPVTTENIEESCEGVYQIAGVFMSLREAMARQGPKAAMAGDFVRAGFADLFVRDDEERDPRVFSEEALRDVIGSIEYSRLDAPEHVVANSISAGSMCPEVTVELPNIPHSRVAAILQWSQPRHLYNEILSKLKIVADKFPDIGVPVSDPPVPVSPVLGEEEDEVPAYVPLSPQYAEEPGGDVASVCVVSPLRAPLLQPMSLAEPKSAPGAPDHDLIRSLAFADEMGIDVDASFMPHCAPEAPVASAYCVVCKSSERAEEMESFCPCWSGCTGNMVHLDCACTLQFYGIVCKASMRTSCGKLVPDLFRTCRVHSAENVDKMLTSVLCAEHPAEADATRLWRPNQVPGHAQLGPQEYVRWDQIRYVNWRRLSRYGELRGQLFAKVKALPPRKVAPHGHRLQPLGASNYVR